MARMIMTDSETDFTTRIIETETEVLAIKQSVERHGVILNDHGGKLDAIMQAVTRQESKQSIDVYKLVGACAQVVMVVVAILSGITWLITTLNSKTSEINRVKIEKNHEINKMIQGYLKYEIERKRASVYSGT